LDFKESLPPPHKSISVTAIWLIRRAYFSDVNTSIFYVYEAVQTQENVLMKVFQYLDQAFLKISVNSSHSLLCRSRQSLELLVFPEAFLNVLDLH